MVRENEPSRHYSQAVSPLAKSSFERQYISEIAISQDWESNTHSVDQKPQLQTFSACLKPWLFEIVSLVICGGIIIASVVLLSKYNGQPLPEWPQGITLNTVLSLFATALKALLLMAVAEGIGQLKWVDFLTPQKLSHLGRFDDSSRGIWGCMRILWFMGFKHVVVLGAIITLVSTVIGPFTQQSINYRYCQQPVDSATSSAMVSRARYLAPYVAGQLEDTDLTPLSFRGSAIEGFISPNRENNAVAFNCPSGNCTYPVHSSLAMCSSCRNAVYQLQHQCGNGTCNSLFPGGIAVGNTESVPGIEYILMSADTGFPEIDTPSIPPVATVGVTYYTTSPCTEDWVHNGTRHNDTDCISASTAYGDDKIQQIKSRLLLNSSLTWPNIGASICKIDWCVQNFEPVVSNGTFTETTSVSSVQIQRIPTTTDSGDFVFVPEPCFLNGTSHSLDQITINRTDNPSYVTLAQNRAVLSDCVYRIDETFRSATVQYFASGNLFGSWEISVLNGTAELGSMGDARFINETTPVFNPIWLQPLFSAGNANLATINQTIATLSQTLTTYLRSHGNNSDNAVGTVYTNKSCVHIAWAWLALPAAVTFFTCIFLAIVVLQSRHLGAACAWKSSPFALALQDLNQEAKDQIGIGLSDNTVFEKTANMRILLVQDGENVRLKQD
ncbi:hypothetical protein BT63DRAFT_480275 [Microthyrium microscopicum]|uniref:Uncharacterized protein n=1 Tax=Microthyrium microscopicum TaxID=703497 RepID=A0A6A6U765_9PEZI|nr:hypothetical protein BT63DRAFT_480275 [Microthyrium microscopicum]